jgi:hypothetical protein
LIWINAAVLQMLSAAPVRPTQSAVACRTGHREVAAMSAMPTLFWIVLLLSIAAFAALICWFL